MIQEIRKNKFEIMVSLSRLAQLISSKILWTEDKQVYRESILIEILIHCHYLLKLADNNGNRIDFTDDVIVDEELNINDVTDLIINLRNAACHNDSNRRKFEQQTFAFIELRGKSKYKYREDLESKYEDDLAFVFGKHLIYLKRHLERVVSELISVFRPFLGDQVMKTFIEKYQ